MLGELDAQLTKSKVNWIVSHVISESLIVIYLVNLLVHKAISTQRFPKYNGLFAHSAHAMLNNLPLSAYFSSR